MQEEKGKIKNFTLYYISNKKKRKNKFAHIK